MADNATFSRRTVLTGAAGAAGAALLSGYGVLDPSRAEAAEEIKVFRSMTNGALVKREPPGTTLRGSPAGLAIRPEGDIYIADRGELIDALPFTLQTSTDSTHLLTVSDADYYDQEQHRENTVTWFDAADQRSIVLTDDGGLVEEWGCRVDGGRRARNDIYPATRPTRVTTSEAGVDRPAIRYDPPNQGVRYGLFFPASPIYYGLQSLALPNATTLQVRMDNDYSPHAPGQNALPFPAATETPSHVRQLNVFLGAWSKSGDFVFRLNGRVVGTDSGYRDRVEYDAVGAVVFYAEELTGAPITQAAIGQGIEWKEAAFTGDIFEVWSMVAVKKDKGSKAK